MIVSARGATIKLHTTQPGTEGTRMFNRIRRTARELQRNWHALDDFVETEKYARSYKPPAQASITIVSTDGPRLGEMLHPDDRADEGRW